MNNWLNRTEYLIGIDNISKLKKSHVAVFGCGGVGSYVIEALARSGVGSLTLIDKDVVDITNINRQLIADTTTIGMPKVEVEKERLLRINPTLRVTTYQMFYDASHADEILNTNFDYVIDAIDTVTAKIELIKRCTELNVPIISSMGTGNKLDPSHLQITDIYKTKIDPLAKVMRRELKSRRIKKCLVAYSDEIPAKTGQRTPGSSVFVPASAGLMIAGYVFQSLIGG